MTTVTGALVLQRDERTGQLDGGGEIFAKELVGEVEHVGRGQQGLPLVVEADIRAQDVSVAAQDFFGLGIPDDELLIGMLHDVELVDVHRLARTSAGGAEGNLAQAADLLHRVGGVMGRNDVNLVVTAVGHAQALVFGEFRLQQFFAYRCNNIFHIQFRVYTRCL